MSANKTNSDKKPANHDATQGSDSSQNATVMTRQQEKQQLSGLNDRLASYIDRVRFLESENTRLQIKIREVEVVERKDKSDLEGRFEAKVSELRKQLDVANREKAKLELERGKAVAGHDELKNKQSKLESDLKKSNAERDRHFNYIQDLTARLNNSENHRMSLETKISAMEKDLSENCAALESARQELENEAVLRTEAEGRAKIYKDDLDFQRRTHVNQLEELRRKRQIEITGFDKEIENRYQTKLAEQLQNMRKDFDARIAINRDEANTRSRIIMEQSQINIQKLEEKIRELQLSNASLIADYQDLLDIKTQLDTELQAYQELLEGEETRLRIPTASGSENVTTTPGPTNISYSSQSTGSRRGTKRPRMSSFVEVDYVRNGKSFKVTSQAEGAVEIDEADPEGQFVRLINTGNEDVSIANWGITNIGGDREVMFKFHSRQQIKAGHTITVWSNNSGQTHDPPTHIVMKHQSWARGDAIRVVLNNQQKTVAWREYILEFGIDNVH